MLLSRSSKRFPFSPAPSHRPFASILNWPGSPICQPSTFSGAKGGQNASEGRTTPVSSKAHSSLSNHLPKTEDAVPNVCQELRLVTTRRAQVRRPGDPRPWRESVLPMATAEVRSSNRSSRSWLVLLPREVRSATAARRSLAPATKRVHQRALTLRHEPPWVPRPGPVRTRASCRRRAERDTRTPCDGASRPNTPTAVTGNHHRGDPSPARLPLNACSLGECPGVLNVDQAVQNRCLPEHRLLGNAFVGNDRRTRRRSGRRRRREKSLLVDASSGAAGHLAKRTEQSAQESLRLLEEGREGLGTSFGVWNRRAGSLASILATSAASSAGTSGRIRFSGSRLPRNVCLVNIVKIFARNGGRPVSR